MEIDIREGDSDRITSIRFSNEEWLDISYLAVGTFEILDEQYQRFTVHVDNIENLIKALRKVQELHRNLEGK